MIDWEAQKTEVRIEEGYSRLDSIICGIPKYVANPYFVKVGANDGLTGDPISQRLVDGPGWTGLLIEPIPYIYELLKANFPDSNRFELLQACVGSEPGSSHFFYVSPEAEKVLNLPEWFDRIGGLSREHIIKHLGMQVNEFIVDLSVEILTLSTILDHRKVSNFELLHIDVEGNDYEVIKSLNWSSQRPMTILVEQKHVPLDVRVEMYETLQAE